MLIDMNGFFGYLKVCVAFLGQPLQGIKNNGFHLSSHLSAFTPTVNFEFFCLEFCQRIHRYLLHLFDLLF
jgi:hypothetical protein